VIYLQKGDSMYHRHFSILCTGIVVVFCLQLLHAQQPKPARNAQESLKQTAQKLAEAMRSKDKAAVRKLAAESVVMLGNLAGVPEVADEYRQAPEQVEPLTKAEALAGFEKILQFVQKNKWWQIGLDPTETEHLPREVATCMMGCLAGCRANAPNEDALLKEAIEAGDYLLWTQQQAGTGVIPFPAYRGGKNPAFQAADRFLRLAKEAGRLDEVVKNGWVFDDLTDGGLQFDNGQCGVALFELYEVTNEKRFLKGAIATADWSLERSCVPNWNYNSFSVYLLATAYRVTHESKYLEAAKEKARLGLLPGQLQDGTYKGRWADQHNARPAYHYIMVRGLTALFAVLPNDDPDQESIANSIRAAMQARNDEFTSKGIMNVDSSLEAILLFKSLSAQQQKVIGSCQTNEAFAVLERHCVSGLRKDGGPFSAGVGGNYFEYIVSQSAR
jgi:hypothetical protein